MIIPPEKGRKTFQSYDEIEEYANARIIAIDSAANWDDPIEAAVAKALKEELEAIAERV